jgi:CheY-like chemotaxis protein
MDNSRTLRLLVVEDNPAYMYLIQKAFSDRESRSWELTIACDGEKAVQLLFKEDRDEAPLPDLILLDWNLPKISGGEVLQRVKHHPDLRKIPILVLSSSDADADILSAYSNHANGYITKPGNYGALEAIVETIERFCMEVHLPKVMR